MIFFLEQRSAVVTLFFGRGSIVLNPCVYILHEIKAILNILQSSHTFTHHHLFSLFFPFFLPHFYLLQSPLLLRIRLLKSLRKKQKITNSRISSENRAEGTDWRQPISRLVDCQSASKSCRLGNRKESDSSPTEEECFVSHYNTSLHYFLKLYYFARRTWHRTSLMIFFLQCTRKPCITKLIMIDFNDS